LTRQSHSRAVSTRPCQRYVLSIGPTICTQAASRRLTSARAMRRASARLAVVVAVWTNFLTLKVSAPAGISQAE